MHFRTAILSLLTASALASPTPRVNEDDDYPILHVTNFGAFVNDDPSMPSHVSFHVVDPRPDNFVETDCILYRAGSLFKTVWVNCENTSDVSFLFASDAMRLQRVFLLDHIQ
ncbi:hypothetical protein EJ04DRAFT_516587 [Polyplosphaeria fusca]|uniref:Uncharacterized protein n=1 Tax=Polyplosphaeria fusca TaxID=682080 RepID=A0A9P4QLD8_9PLEO|nr:hypothetical protein EJ04DRAFT_516587 [Polyplosphaeria fusca]